MGHGSCRWALGMALFLGATASWGQTFGDDVAFLRSHTTVVVLKGTVVHERSRRRAYDVNVYGVDGRFWDLQRLAVPAFAQDDGALVGTPLAVKYGADVAKPALLFQHGKLAGSLDFIICTANVTLDWAAIVGALAPRQQ